MSVKITAKYLGEKRLEYTHLGSGAKIQTDAPVDNNGKGEAFSPTDLVASALFGCMSTIIGITAQKRGLDISGMRFQLEKNMSTGAPRRIEKIVGSIHLPKSLSDSDRELLEKNAKNCPVHHSLNSDVNVEVDFIYDL